MRTRAAILLSAITIVRAAVSKRGLNLGSSDYEQVDLPKYLVSPLLTWVYNYDPVPTQGESYGNLSYVPMLWGKNGSSQFRTTFLSGPRYPYILSFNEPDMTQDVGGSNLSVEAAVSIWQAQLQPLDHDGYKIGLPSGVSFAG
jgi:Glycosyl hydrolase catalytic core